VPEGYDFSKILNALNVFNHFFEMHKYKHNYDYQLALLIMNNKFYMTNGSIILTENQQIFSPISQLNYEYYTNKKVLINELQQNNDIQCIVGEGFIPFGEAQKPSLTNFADGVDTMQFLLQLVKKLIKAVIIAVVTYNYVPDISFYYVICWQINRLLTRYTLFDVTE